MKLSGKYNIDSLIDTLQGEFSCRLIKKDTTKYISLCLFYLEFRIYKDKVDVYTNDSGAKRLITTLQGT